MKRNCDCKKLIGYTGTNELVIHLMGCPKDSYVAEYAALPWWKKLIYRSPESLYSEHYNP